jgi:hypothetical protein
MKCFDQYDCIYLKKWYENHGFGLNEPMSECECPHDIQENHVDSTEDCPYYKKEID